MQGHPGKRDGRGPLGGAGAAVLAAAVMLRKAVHGGNRAPTDIADDVVRGGGAGGGEWTAPARVQVRMASAPPLSLYPAAVGSTFTEGAHFTGGRGGCVAGLQT